MKKKITLFLVIVLGVIGVGSGVWLSKSYAACQLAQEALITDDNITVENGEVEYALLPVWMLNINYEGNRYTFAMNGQTGKMVGNVPIEKKKVVKYSLKLFSIIFIVIFIISTILGMI